MSKLAKSSSVHAQFRPWAMSNINIIWLILKNVVPLWYKMRLSIRNKMQPTRSLYDIRFKSYDSISAFHVFGDPDLDLWHIPILQIFLSISHNIPWYLHIKCCNNRISFNIVMVWYRAANTQIHNYMQTDRQAHKHQHYNNILLRD